MKKLTPVVAAALLVATLGIGTVGAASNTSTTSSPQPSVVKTPTVHAIVTKVAAQGGRIYVVVQVRNCNRLTAANYVVTADSSAGSVTLKRSGVIMNAGSKSRSCVYRGRIYLTASAPVGNMSVTVNVQRMTAAVGGSAVGTPWSKVFTTKILKKPAN